MFKSKRRKGSIRKVEKGFIFHLINSHRWLRRLRGWNWHGDVENGTEGFCIKRPFIFIVTKWSEVWSINRRAAQVCKGRTNAIKWLWNGSKYQWSIVWTNIVDCCRIHSILFSRRTKSMVIMLLIIRASINKEEEKLKEYLYDDALLYKPDGLVELLLKYNWIEY